jgi:predicted nucleotidyltransferase
MKQKLIVQKKIEGVKVGLIGLENMMSMNNLSREDFLNQINKVKALALELEILVNRESEEWV